MVVLMHTLDALSSWLGLLYFISPCVFCGLPKIQCYWTNFPDGTLRNGQRMLQPWLNQSSHVVDKLHLCSVPQTTGSFPSMNSNPTFPMASWQLRSWRSSSTQSIPITQSKSLGCFIFDSVVEDRVDIWVMEERWVSQMVHTRRTAVYTLACKVCWFELVFHSPLW